MLNLTAGGQVQMTGGSIGGEGVVTNQSIFIWTGGSVVGSGGLRNDGQLTISGNGGQAIQPGSVLTNTGTITQTTDGALCISGATLNNSFGAVYDLQGNGQISGSGGTINNAGLFQRSASASLGSNYFNNTGTVEVDSGTLDISNGSSISANYQFANGSRVNASLTWQGATTANGNGVLGVGGNVAAGTAASFSSSGFTNGAGLEIGNGSTGRLYVDAGSILTLNMTGSQQAKMVSGLLYGAGTTINLGNFAFMGGQIDGYGTGMLLVNQGNFVWTGGIVVDNGLLNQGSLTISGSGGQSIGTGTYWYPSPGVLTNAGTITHATDGVLLMVGGSVLNNLAGAVYDLQGDGQITTDVNWWAGGTINNAGLFRTSSGTGTSSIHPYIAFNNTGTVEVDSGTLTFGSGSSVAAHYEFAAGRGWRRRWSGRERRQLTATGS